MSFLKDYFTVNAYGLKFYKADGDGKKPFALICPGGGYAMVSSHNEGEPFAKKLNSLGYNAFVLRYRVREQAKCPAPLDDAARALKHILDNAEEYGVLKDGYSLWGSSAGGHLAALFASERICKNTYKLPQPSALVLIYPVITMGELTHEDSKNNFLGRNPLPEEIKAASVEENVNASYPPTFLWNSKEDDCVHPDNGLIMKNALDKFGVDCRFMQFEKGAHGAGLGTGTECEPWFDEAVAFWKEHVIHEA
ncbi:MAG: alpha/beta hydrolase [Eubacterium sp.]|nr:alpha/beta hydrolase [Eubacterium sp.]